MERIGRKQLWGFVGDNDIDVVEQEDVAAGEGKVVHDYNDLIRTLAKIQYHNPNFVLMLRGQTRDYKARRKTILKPSILREIDRRYPGREELSTRFDMLREAERLLVHGFEQHDIPDPNARIVKHRIVRWAILQHYKIVDTPLLDVTLSPRVAASFASTGGEQRDWGYIYVLAVPNVSAAITTSAEEGLQIIRLSSVCPYVAMRPGVQEGYLIGEYPELDTMESKRVVPYEETDFSLRLISKIKLRPQEFWALSGIPRPAEEHLYPDEDRNFEIMMDEIRQRI